MTWQQAFVLAWIQFALASAGLLWGALAIIRRLRQPAERARLIPLVLAAALAVPALALCAPWPVWNLGWFSRPAVTATSPAAPASRSISAAVPAPADDAPNIAPTRSVARVAAHGEFAHQDASESAPTIRRTLSAWSVAVWSIVGLHLVAAGVFVARWWIARRRLALLCRSSRAAASCIEEHWHDVAGRRGAAVRLLVSQGIDAPLVYSWLRPTILLPESIASGDSAALGYALAHEWSHIERGDLLAWAWVRACQYLLWYQPAYWLLARELRVSQELLADQRATASEDDRLEYSELLLALAKNRRTAPLAGALNLFDEPSELGRRVRLLVEGTRLAVRCRIRVALAAIALSAAAACALSAIRLDAAPAEGTSKSETETRTASTAKTMRSHPSVEAFKEAEKREAQPGSQPAALGYTGRVVEKGTKNPIAGASVVVRRSDSSAEQYTIVEESKHTTDAEGKFSFVIPPEQVAIKRLYIELDVEHPDYTARKGHGYGLSMIVKNEALGDPPFFALTELDPADPVTGTVVAPDGTPLAGIKIQGFSRPELQNFRDSSFVDTVTGADGKFRLPLVKEGFAVLWVIPKDFAPEQKYLGKQRGDLGEFRLQPGVRAEGQVVDVAGKPVANVPVNIHLERNRDNNDEFNQLAVFTSVRRAALSDADGRFRFEPLPAGDYQLAIEDHLSDPIERDRRRFSIPMVFLGQKVTLQADRAEIPRIQAIPHVIFEAQYYNSQGERTNGHNLRLWGKLDGAFWHGQGRTVDGLSRIIAPHGLQEAKLQLSTNEHSSLRYRVRKGEPLKSERISIDLGTLDDDLVGVEIVRYIAPIVLVSAVDEEGKIVPDAKVTAAYPWGQQRYILEGEARSDLTFEKQPDGRRRSEQMLPDEEVTFTAAAKGYESASEKLSLPEGETRELTLVLKKASSAAEADSVSSAEGGSPKE